MTLPAVLLDVDGTLVDTNYQHALTWFRALRQHGAIVPLWRIQRHIGMGGDQLVPALAGEEFERRFGDDARTAETTLYEQFIQEVEPLPGARELVRELRERGHVVILASSGKQREIEHYLGLLEIGELIDGYTSSDDVEQTKPDPDVVKAALEKVRENADGDGDDAANSAVLIGDSTWDCKAAARAGIRSIGLLSGGYGADELRVAGAAGVYEDAAELRRELGNTPLTA